MKLLILLLFPALVSAQIRTDSIVILNKAGAPVRYTMPVMYVAPTGTDSIVVRSSATGKRSLIPQSTFALSNHIHNYLVAADIAGKVNNTVTVNGQPLSGNVNTVLAQVNATAQTANIATTTLYAVPATGFYRVSIYITVTSIGTTSTMPSTTITYTDGNSGTNVHSTVTTATATTNSLTTTFAQATYVCYAKTGTNIKYATGSYASTGTAMQYALRIRLEAL